MKEMTVDEMDRVASDSVLRAAERHMDDSYEEAEEHECRHCYFALPLEGGRDGQMVCMHEAALVGRTGWTGWAGLLDKYDTAEDGDCEAWEEA